MSKTEQPAGSWNLMKKDSEKAPEEPVTKVSFQRLSTADPTKFLKVAFHGSPKTGKTRTSLSFPPPVYVIATEPGLRPLIGLYPDKEIFFVDVYVPDTENIFEVEPTKTLANIDASVKYIRELVQKDPNSVGTVVVDSVTDIWKWVQEWMKLDILKIDKTARVRQQWDWGYANTKYQNIIMQLLSLPAHLVLTAQDKEEYAGPGAGSGVYSPRWMSQTPFWVDIVIGLTKLRDPKLGSIKYMATIEDSRHMNEALKPVAGTDFENPTFDKLMEILKKKE